MIRKDRGYLGVIEHHRGYKIGLHLRDDYPASYYIEVKRSSDLHKAIRKRSVLYQGKKYWVTRAWAVDDVIKLHRGVSWESLKNQDFRFIGCDYGHYKDEVDGTEEPTLDQLRVDAHAAIDGFLKRIGK